MKNKHQYWEITTVMISMGMCETYTRTNCWQYIVCVIDFLL